MKGSFYYFGGPNDGELIAHPLDGKPLHLHDVLPREIRLEAGVYVWNAKTERYEWAGRGT